MVLVSMPHLGAYLLLGTQPDSDDGSLKCVLAIPFPMSIFDSSCTRFLNDRIADSIPFRVQICPSLWYKNRFPGGYSSYIDTCATFATKIRKCKEIFRRSLRSGGEICRTHSLSSVTLRSRYQAENWTIQRTEYRTRSKSTLAITSCNILFH
jgi:hypothetical protein